MKKKKNSCIRCREGDCCGGSGVLSTVGLVVAASWCLICGGAGGVGGAGWCLICGDGGGAGGGGWLLLVPRLRSSSPAVAVVLAVLLVVGTSHRHPPHARPLLLSWLSLLAVRQSLHCCCCDCWWWLCWRWRFVPVVVVVVQ